MPQSVKRKANRAAGAERSTDGDRRPELVAVAARLFRERGYEATSTQEIATEMKIRKATLYHYVRSKEDLLWMVVEAPLRELVDNAAEILSPENPAPMLEKLANAMAAHARSFEAHYPDMFVITQEHGKALSPKRRREFDAMREEYTALFIAAVQAGIASSELRPDLEPRLTVYAMLGMLNWMFRWFTPGRGFTADEIAVSFADLLITGIGPGGTARSGRHGRASRRPPESSGR
jgi:TetR/AcrR family transcriptional regulator, cholesterol catabolism regulator